MLFSLRLIDLEQKDASVVRVMKTGPCRNKKTWFFTAASNIFYLLFKVPYVSVDGASWNKAMVKSALKIGKKKGETWTTVNPNVPDGEITWLMNVKESAAPAQESAVKFRIK